jgi:predicted dehydrogenase
MKTLSLLTFLMISSQLYGQKSPLKIGVIGLTHTHVHWIFESEKRGDFEIVGIVEPNRELAQRYAEQHGYSMDKVFDTSKELLDKTTVEAVTAFGNIYDHLSVVETFAPKGIHVMVEKPLAVSLEHAKKMEKLAQKHHIHLLTNYETTWYPTNHKAYELTRKDSLIGDIRKVVVRDGHRGPKKIGINQEFLDWLADPELNGGGAITDFGCYGANLLTWLMDGERPQSVTTITRQLQAENNPKVDDEAIIILNYSHSVAIIQASWNWPMGRKDMEIYGLTGAIYADNRHNLRVRIAEGYDGYKEEIMKLEERNPPFDDPFSLLTALINEDIQLPANDLSSLENNMIVMEILDAAIRSAKKGRTIELKKK